MGERGRSVLQDQFVRVDSTTSDDLFLQSLQEDSNLEMDWLWLATQVISDGERRYCLQRALAINPGSLLAQRGLIQLRKHPGKPLKLA